MDRIERARAYYESLDRHEYERLGSLLAPGFVHERPDLLLDGRDRFVQFMREERPDPNTTHEVDAIYESRERVAVTGRLYTADGALLSTFLDDFAFTEGEPAAPVIQSITTYSRVAAPDAASAASAGED